MIKTASEAEIARLVINRPWEHGPFDIIGDVHGCYDELIELLMRLGYQEDGGVYRHAAGRRVVFLGDLVNRGPNSVGVVQLVGRMVEANTALNVRGNHCHYVLGYFRHYAGPEYNRRRGWVEALEPTARAEFGELLEKVVGSSPPYLILDEGRLVACHAGIERDMIGQLTEPIFNFCLYGELTNKLNEQGFPKRRDWAATYNGAAFIAYGHTPTMTEQPEIRFNTVNLDQGCCFGGYLSALRYPEMETVSVKAVQNYSQVIIGKLLLN